MCVFFSHCLDVYSEASAVQLYFLEWGYDWMCNYFTLAQQGRVHANFLAGPSWWCRVMLFHHRLQLGALVKLYFLIFYSKHLENKKHLSS